MKDNTILVIDGDFKHLNNCSILLSKLGYKVIVTEKLKYGVSL